MHDSQDIESATTAVQSSGSSVQPDSKTRRYDRQLRLWAASGQSALESARVLVISASATSTSILKNLVLPGIGHFTILDPDTVTPQDAGNNFFFEGPDSIDKPRAEEAVRLLLELNDSVDGRPDVSSLHERLTDVSYLSSFNLVIAHNLQKSLLDKLSSLLWADQSLPPLIVVRSSGFLSEFFIQIHEHTVIDSHPDTAPSLRIDKPFPALLDYALSLDFASMDSTDLGHVPYIYILVRAMEDWKNSHGGKLPQNYTERTELKKSISKLKRKGDEENVDEALAQAYRAWTETKVPSDITALFSDPVLDTLSPSSPPFFHLLSALKKFVSQPPYTLPLTSTLPDMKADTTSYVHLQKLYKSQALEERNRFAEILTKDGVPGVEIDPGMVDEFVRNVHGLKVIRGRQWGALDENREAIKTFLDSEDTRSAIATHLALSALSELLAISAEGQTPTKEQLTACIRAKYPDLGELSEELTNAIGEVERTPTADLPNTAAFLGGLVAQEAIKIITKQYVPVKGTCVVDLIASKTGILDA